MLPFDGKYFLGFLDFMWEFFGLCFYFSFYIMISGNFYGLEIRHGIFLVLNFVGGIFWGFVGSPRDAPIR